MTSAARDCSERFRSGVTAPGVSDLDPVGDGSVAVAAGCGEDGWTNILTRGQHGNTEVGGKIN